MRINSLLKILQEANSIPIKRKELATKMRLSESTIRNIIRELENSQEKNGFYIELKKGKGYILQIRDNDKFKKFIVINDTHNDDVYDPQQRVSMLLFYLLQAEGYITISSLETKMSLSRSTIVKDLKSVEEQLARYNLTLERKVHYGIIIKGDEQDFRRGFSNFVLGSKYYVEPAKDYKYFINSVNTKQLRKVLGNALENNKLKITDIAFDNIINHLKILMFRASQQNFISVKSTFTLKVDDVYINVAKYVIDWITKNYDISFPESEINFLGVHISAKSITASIVSEEKSRLIEQILVILTQLDKEFLSDFSKDVELQDALLLHMYPLINRLYYNLQLENPLIEEIYTKFSNVFVVSYRFGNLIEKEYGYVLSRDEIGYIALHFATHFERQKIKTIQKVKRIVVICATGGGSAQLLKLKLENIFTNAIIVTCSSKDMPIFANELPDLFLSTIQIDDIYPEIPTIQIKEFLNEQEIRKIKEHVYIQLSNKIDSKQTLKISNLFKKEFFRRVNEINYLKIIKDECNKMIVEGYAAKDFTNLVLEREEKFSTIYQNGVAGPHGMKLNAKKDLVSVLILENPTVWQDRTVQLIFLINLKQGHLFLHKEISRLLLSLIENDIARNRLIQASSFEQFMAEIEKLEYGEGK